MNHKTIAAIGTPLGPGGIGIIRISGPQAYSILKKLFLRKTRGFEKDKVCSKSKDVTPHVLYYGFIHHPVEKRVIDEVLAVYMKAPKSFTREDVVEIHSHSGFVVLDKILSLIIDSGAILADPGEFSKRAFLNGRIDLTQAEAIIDLINAPCETAAAIAGSQVAGGMKRVVEHLHKKVVALLAQCEAAIEFGDEIESSPGVLMKGIQQTFTKFILPEIQLLIKKQKEMAVFKEGLHLSIGGMPNVGKSSLLNRLVEKEVAIVSDFPGTTRDVVREYMSINGVPVTVYDTAGIHDTSDPVECMGIEKAKTQINCSDIVLWVLDGSRDIDEGESVTVENTTIEKTIVVINKMDISDDKRMSDLEKRFAPDVCIRVSAKEGTNIELLKDKIFTKLTLDGSVIDAGQISPNLRQRKVFEKIYEESEPLADTKHNDVPMDLVSMKLHKIKNLLEQISGNSYQIDIYDQIFSQFCVGK